MKSSIFLTALIALYVDAQQSGKGAKGAKGKDPYHYKAGDKLPEGINPLDLFDKTPSWPSNFGGAPMARGPTPGGCAPLELIIGKTSGPPYWCTTVLRTY